MRNRAVRGCLILFPLLILTATLAKSNNPSPSPPEIRKPEQSKSGEPEAPAQKNQNRTAIPPLIIKEAPAPKAQKEPAENTKEADSKSSTDWWMVWLTGILAFVASLQLIVFGLQARRLRQTIETMKKIGADQSRDMQASIAIAKESAEAAKLSADTAIDSNKLTRDLFYAEQRPWLILEITGWSPLIWEDKGARFSIDVTITNAGKSPATNVWFEAVAFPSGRFNQASVETVRAYCVERATSRDSVIDNGIIVVPGHPYRTGFNLMLFRDEIDKNIFMDEDWFSPAIKTCIAYRSAIDQNTKYAGSMYLGVDISEGSPKLLRISKGNLTQFGVSHHPGCDIAT
jgi:hypothetical protein